VSALKSVWGIRSWKTGPSRAGLRAAALAAASRARARAPDLGRGRAAALCRAIASAFSLARPASTAWCSAGTARPWPRRSRRVPASPSRTSRSPATGRRPKSTFSRSIGLDGWTALIGFDAGEARDRIARLPWVEQVAVRKVYPSTLEVDIVERRPSPYGSRAPAVRRRCRGPVIAPTPAGGMQPAARHRHGRGGRPAPGSLADHGGHPELACACRRLHPRRGKALGSQARQRRHHPGLPEDGVERALREIVALDASMAFCRATSFPSTCVFPTASSCG
jgi:hypothetical protein